MNRGRCVLHTRSLTSWRTTAWTEQEVNVTVAGGVEAGAEHHLWVYFIFEDQHWNGRTGFHVEDRVMDKPRTGIRDTTALTCKINTLTDSVEEPQRRLSFTLIPLAWIDTEQRPRTFSKPNRRLRKEQRYRMRTMTIVQSRLRCLQDQFNFCLGIAGSNYTSTRGFI